MTAQSYASRYPKARGSSILNEVRKDNTTRQLRREVAHDPKMLDALSTLLLNANLRRHAPELDTGDWGAH